MCPTLMPGDLLLLDPTARRWPRRGTLVVIREPGSEVLAIKRVAARPGDEILAPEGPRRLGPFDAWLLSDDPSGSIDSRRYGPVGLNRVVARAWFRYWPLHRIGRLRPSRTP